MTAPRVLNYVRQGGVMVFTISAHVCNRDLQALMKDAINLKVSDSYRADETS